MSAYLTIDDDASAIRPFWRRLPRFFAFPLHPAVLARVALLSLLSVLPFAMDGSWLFLPFMAGALLAAWMICLRHAYLVLEQTSLGRLSPSQYPPDTHSGPYKAYKQLVVFVVMGVAVAAAGWLAGSAGFLVAYAVVMLAMPASVMAMAVTDRFGEALNPFRLAHIVTAIGWPYLALCFFLASLSAGSEALYQLISDQWPPAAIVFAAQFVAIYFTYIMFHMMGYVLYQYHSRIGLSVSIPFAESGERAGAAPRSTDAMTEKLGAMVAAGNLEAALEHAYEDQRANPFNVPSHERYHRLLVLAGGGERMLAHARRYLALLLRQDLLPQGLALFEECVRLDAEFRPEEGHEAMALAEAAARARRQDLALALMRRFDKRYPGHRDIPRAYMLSAELLCERHRDDERAIQILRLLLARHPGHEVAERARRYLATLEKLRNGGAAPPRR